MTTAVTGNDLADTLRKRFPDAVVAEDEGAVWVMPAAIRDVCEYLRGDASHDYALLNAITGVDYVDHFEMVYQMTSIARNASTVVKTKVYGREAPRLPSVISVWKGADLQEREIFDLLGVAFEGHPNLKRLLTWEGFEGHPLRRDYLEPPLPYSWPQGG